MNKRKEVLKRYPNAICKSYIVTKYGHSELFWSVFINEEKIGWSGNPKGAWSYVYSKLRGDNEGY